MQLVVGGKVCKRPKLLADNNCQCLPSSHEKALVVRLENELKLQTKDWAGWLAGWLAVVWLAGCSCCCCCCWWWFLFFFFTTAAAETGWLVGWLVWGLVDYQGIYISTTTLESESNLLSYLWRILH
jgi:hypothetical protein